MKSVFYSNPSTKVIKSALRVIFDRAVFALTNWLIIMIKAGILGGGQLGRMLLQEAANYPVETHVLENDPQCPAAHLCHHFTTGDIRNFDDVYAFGKKLDVITIEIESVNADALEKLEAEGVRVIPKPSVLRIIQNKIRQKEFYRDNGILTSPFVITQSKKELAAHAGIFPAVHKLATGGYDGRGVQILREVSDSDLGFDAPAVLEKSVDIKKEISVIVAVSQSGQSALYPPVDMVFDPLLNLLSYQMAPAEIPKEVRWKAEALALNVVKALGSPGIFAVECFVDREDNVFVNETAPRVHNSGHHTIEASFSSQYDMLWRILLDYPPGSTDSILSAAMINIVGAAGCSGTVYYEGLGEVLKIENAFVHIYGKRETKPGRKMGHVTIISNDRQDLIYKINRVRQMLFAKTK